MMKRFVLVLLIVVLPCSWLGISGCSQKANAPADKPAEIPTANQTMAKLKSEDPSVQMKGLDEASQLYGGKDDKPQEKPTRATLDSNDASEQKKGLEEAGKKDGGGA